MGRTKGKAAQSATAKKNVAAMKKKGGHLRPEEAQRCVGGYLRREDPAAYGSDEEDLGLHQEAQPQPGSRHQAGCGVEGRPPGGEFGYAQDGRFRQQASVLRPLGEPRRPSRNVPT